MGKLNCILCGEPLHYSKENVCGGHGDFYHKYKCGCKKCGVVVSCDNYFSSRNERLDDCYFNLLNEEYLIRAEPQKKHFDIVNRLKKTNPDLYNSLFKD